MIAIEKKKKVKEEITVSVIFDGKTHVAEALNIYTIYTTICTMLCY